MHRWLPNRRDKDTGPGIDWIVVTANALCLGVVILASSNARTPVISDPLPASVEIAGLMQDTGS